MLVLETVWAGSEKHATVKYSTEADRENPSILTVPEVPLGHMLRTFIIEHLRT
jgi:hypothetical protein